MIVAPAGWRDGVRAAGTTYQWPLRDWFQAGPLNLSLNSGVTLCQGQADCDTAAFQDLGGGFHIWDKATSGVIAQSFFYGNLEDRNDEGDYKIKLRKLVEFLEDGDKTKVTLRFRGREMAHKELGAQLLARVRSDLEEFGVVEQMPQLEGRQMVMVMAPKKK